MASITWGPEIAEVYDKTYAAKFEPPVLGPTVDLLAELARAGPRWRRPASIQGRARTLGSAIYRYLPA